MEIWEECRELVPEGNHFFIQQGEGDVVTRKVGRRGTSEKRKEDD